MFSVLDKLHIQLAQFEDPVIVMNNLLWAKLFVGTAIPPEGAVLPDPSGSGIQVIIDNKVDPLDLMIVERSDRQK